MYTVSTRTEGRKPAGGVAFAARRLSAATRHDPADAVARVALARRDLLLRVHRHRLRPEDLEDCYSQATLELLTRARAGGRFEDATHISNALAQDYVTWGLPGPGRWVTIYATTTPTEHVFVVIAGLRLDTSHRGTDVGPNRDQDGPRWRILDHLPGWAAWAVRHPPGL